MKTQLALKVRQDTAGSSSVDTSPQESTDSVREAQKLHLYAKYANYYTLNDNELMLKSMVVRAMELDETCCIIFDEKTDEANGITANDLEEIFEDSPEENKPSLKMIISAQTKGFRHIQKVRVAHTMDEFSSYVTVQYIIVWPKRKDH